MEHRGSPDLTPLNRIRVETALSRFPIHNLAKKGPVLIDLKHPADGIQAALLWRVSYNSEFGQPGPLAYKIDTLIVNRRIDEAPRPLPEIIRLGSLREICRELGITDGNTNMIKTALYQNAFAAITAKIRHKTKNGAERWAEIGYTRYSVVFSGEKLPNGSIADAVSIIINPQFRDLLNHVEVRPLDYDYLAALAPTAQRFYELVSFQIYGTIASGRARAKMLYSNYCKYAPQQRYFDFDHVKKQMYKVHRPHRSSGYIAKVEYQEIVDIEGKADWEMFYTPGPKSVEEYKVFTNRRICHQPRAETQSAAQPVPNSKPQPLIRQATLQLTETNATLVAELTHRGVAEKKAHELLANLKPGQEVIDQLEYVDSLIAKDRRQKLNNPPGLYVFYVRDNITPPANFWSSRKARLHEQAQQAKNAERARQAQLELDYDEYQEAEIQRYMGETMPQEEYQQMFAQLRHDNRRTFKQMTALQLDELTLRSIAHELKESDRVPLLSFEEFCRQADVQ